MANPSNKLTAEQKREALDAVAEYGSQVKAARALGISRATLQHRLSEAMADLDNSQPELPLIGGRVKPSPNVQFPQPRKGAVFRYIFTCAQADTYLHEETWQSLQTLAAHYRARIVVSTFSYDLSSYGKKSVKKGNDKHNRPGDEQWFDPRIKDFILDENADVAPGLMWCGKMNILPTAVRPLSGLEAYTGRKSGIIPHVKFAMESVASGKFEGTKFNYTTGTITQRNYIAKKAGLKAEFHHGYGGVLVEVDSAGNWFVRQLNATSDGEIQDLDVVVRGAELTTGNRIEAISWGDIHWGTVDPAIVNLFWGEGGVIDALRPKYQFMHDVLNFHSANHHDRNNPHVRFRRYIEGRDDVLRELKECMEFLFSKSARSFCRTLIVKSNHDEALERWLREADYRHDPKNAIIFLEAQLAFYKAIAAGDTSFDPVEWFYKHFIGNDGGTCRFLRTDESFIICPDANGGIEMSMHGHLGPNGMRGSGPAFARMGRKSVTQHSHSAGIWDGAFVGGITGDLDQGYNRGPSSWSRSFVGTYPNGKRTIITVWGNKWRA